MKSELKTEWVTEDKPPANKQRSPIDSAFKFVEEKIPDSQEQKRIINFIKNSTSSSGPNTLVVKEGDALQAWVKILSTVIWSSIPDEDTGEKPIPELSLRTEYIAVGGWAKSRKKAARTLLEELLRHAKEVDSDSIHIDRVATGDSEVIDVLRDLGFEKISTSYEMQKTLR